MKNGTRIREGGRGRVGGSVSVWAMPVGVGYGAIHFRLLVGCGCPRYAVVLRRVVVVLAVTLCCGIQRCPCP